MMARKRAGRFSTYHNCLNINGALISFHKQSQAALCEDKVSAQAIDEEVFTFENSNIDAFAWCPLVSSSESIQ